MRKLQTIQIKNNLNEVYAVDKIGNGGANHEYHIVQCTEDTDYATLVGTVLFQNGPRNDPNSDFGVLDCDLLEIVRDRLKSFQSGPYATEYNAQALMNIEEALMWMNRRVEDRIERGVLGTMEK